MPLAHPANVEKIELDMAAIGVRRQVGALAALVLLHVAEVHVFFGARDDEWH